MTIRRRHVLIGGAGATCAALGFARLCSAGATPPVPSGVGPGAVLFLHDGHPDAAAHHARLAASLSPAILHAQRIALLAPSGFGHVQELLDRAGDGRLVALTDTASAIALEMMLFARRAVLIDRTPAAEGATLLSAVMGERG